MKITKTVSHEVCLTAADILALANLQNPNFPKDMKKVQNIYFDEGRQEVSITWTEKE